MVTAGPEHPGVDVVIATHNRPEQLRVALAAVLEQSYQGPIVCHVVFDQSTPDLDLICRQGNREVRVHANTERTPGLAGARNTGIVAGDLPFVAFCDDDDVWAPEKLECQIHELRQAPEAVACVSGIVVKYVDRDVVRVPKRGSMTLESLVRNRIMEAHPSTVMVRRSALVDDIGLVDERLPGSYAEDYDWIIRAARVGSFAVAHEPLVSVHWGQSQFSQRWDVIYEALDYLVEKHPEFREDNRALARIRGQQAFARAAVGRRRDSWHRSRECLRLNPRERRAYIALLVSTGVVSARKVMDVAHKRGHGI